MQCYVLLFNWFFSGVVGMCSVLPFLFLSWCVLPFPLSYSEPYYRWSDELAIDWICRVNYRDKRGNDDDMLWGASSSFSPCRYWPDPCEMPLLVAVCLPILKPETLFFVIYLSVVYEIFILVKNLCFNKRVNYWLVLQLESFAGVLGGWGKHPCLCCGLPKQAVTIHCWACYFSWIW